VTNVLVDTSAWVGFFRGAKAFVHPVDELLSEGTAAIAGPIWSEVVSGARTRAEFSLLSRKLRGLNWLDAPPDIWSLVAESRYALARQGIQAHLIDLFIAQTAHENQCGLLTADRDFQFIAKVVPIEVMLID
jgi:predicted nucleic acid-binding protein